MQSRNPANVPIIDVSKWQGQIDWLAVAASGIKGAMVKSSEGVGYIDPLFRRNAVGVPATGMRVGFYHYCRPETLNTAKAEAEHYLETVAGLPADLPYVLDVEGDAAKLGASKLTDWCCEWLETVEKRSGHPVMVYTGGSFARSFLASKLARWPLWIAHYGVDTPMTNGTWDKWAMFQYSDAGSVPGISGRVDMNEMDLSYWQGITGEGNGVDKPTVIKDRIIARDGKLEYLTFDYKKPGTDVRLLKLERGKAKFKLVARPGAKVSELVREYGADYGFNFPYFDPSAKLPVGTVWDGTGYVNGAWGKTHKWHFLTFKHGCAEIRLPGSGVDDCDCAFSGSPLLVSNGRAAWDYYREKEETATDIGRDANGNLVRCQRTFAGIDAEGNLLLAVSDGRTRSDQGLTLEEMALYMLDKGVVWAINGDGGGSSIIADQSGGLNQDENVGANERAVHHALLIFLQPVEQPEDWKQESVKWLNTQGLTDAVRDPDTTPTWAELGVVLRKMK
jgi:GH25 family lysozyme M1 (1,4-beta-N-acetylmuramidase)